MWPVLGFYKLKILIIPPPLSICPIARDRTNVILFNFYLKVICSGVCPPPAILFLWGGFGIINLPFSSMLVIYFYPNGGR